MKAKPNGGREPEKPRPDKSLAPPAESANATSEVAARLDSDREKIRWFIEHREEYSAKLLQNIKAQLPQLEELLAKVEDHWGMEDGVYRFYHQSFKVYYLQNLTEEICKKLAALLPDRPMNSWFQEIVKQGTGHQFDASHNEDWTKHTRPILEAVFHAHYFLKMTCKYGRELETPPSAMPSGWASVLYLFDLR